MSIYIWTAQDVSNWYERGENPDLVLLKDHAAEVDTLKARVRELEGALQEFIERPGTKYHPNPIPIWVQARAQELLRNREAQEVDETGEEPSHD